MDMLYVELLFTSKRSVWFYFYIQLVMCRQCSAGAGLAFFQLRDTVAEWLVYQLNDLLVTGSNSDGDTQFMRNNLE